MGRGKCSKGGEKRQARRKALTASGPCMPSPIHPASGKRARAAASLQTGNRRLNVHGHNTTRRHRHTLHTRRHQLSQEHAHQEQPQPTWNARKSNKQPQRQPTNQQQSTAFSPFAESGLSFSAWLQSYTAEAGFFISSSTAARPAISSADFGLASTAAPKLAIASAYCLLASCSWALAFMLTALSDISSLTSLVGSPSCALGGNGGNGENGEKEQGKQQNNTKHDTMSIQQREEN